MYNCKLTSVTSKFVSSCFKIFTLLLLFTIVHSESIFTVTKHGVLRGFVNTTGRGQKARLFLGVPYAKAPVDELRFEYPQEVEPWHGFYDATHLRPNCPQLEGDWNEDCLYLNIYAPLEGTNYPVLTWIHGGSYQWGAGNDFHVEGVIDNLVSQGMIVVFVNYRLGFLGFASTLTNDLDGNYGLEDQVMALKWIHENIEMFGGANRKVTLAGESSGAASASLLAMSPKLAQKDYFQQIMLRSGSGLGPFAVRNSETKKNTKKVLASINCTETADTRKCLRAIGIEVIILAVEHVANSIAENYEKYSMENELLFGFAHFSPVKDDHREHGESLLPDDVRKLVVNNARLPLLIGTTRSELLEYSTEEINRFNYSLVSNVHRHIITSLYDVDEIEKVMEEIREHYMIDHNVKRSGLATAVTKLVSDQVFIYPSFEEARIYSNSGNSVYVYIFDRFNERMMKPHEAIIDEPNFDGGAAHGFDLIYLFESSRVTSAAYFGAEETLSLDDNDEKVTKFLAESIHNFVSTSNPSTDDLRWLRFSATEKVNCVSIDGTGPFGAHRTNYHENSCSFWDYISQKKVSDHF